MIRKYKRVCNSRITQVSTARLQTQTKGSFINHGIADLFVNHDEFIN